MKSLKLNFTIVYFLFLFMVSYSQVKNIGLPDIRNYKKYDYKGETQNWDINQDKNGNIYFANNAGLLQFDGSSWTKYTLPNNSEIRSVKIDSSGKIFVGGYNEFGYFKANAKGKLIYFSLSKLFDRKKIKILDYVWKIHLFKGEVFFQSFARIYIYKDGKIRLLQAPTRFQFSYQVKEKLYIQDIFKGIMEYRNKQLILLKGTEILNNTEIWGMFSLPNNKILIATLDKGLFIYENEKISSWSTDANEFIKKNNSLGGTSIKNDFIVLNTVLNGMIICNSNGKIIQHINYLKGLQNNTVLSSFVDKNNNLWLGLDNGIAYINENSPFTYFGFCYNLGTVYASVIYKNYLYVATNQGVFYHPWNLPFKEETFKLVKGTNAQAWNVQVMDNQLLCASNRGVHVLDQGKLIQTLDKRGHFGFKKIPNHPNFIIGANYSGFTIFEKTINGWQFRNNIAGSDKSTNSFEIEGDNLWLKKDNSIYKMKFSEDLKRFSSVHLYRNLSKFNNGVDCILLIKKQVYFAVNNRFYKYSKEQNLFFEDNEISNLFQKIPKINLLKEDDYGNLWYVFKESLGVLMKTKTGSYHNIVVPFSNLTGNLVKNIISVNTINSHNIFIGLTDGLAHYDSQIFNNYVIKPKSFIRNIIHATDTLILENGQNESKKIKIPYTSNSVKFTFSTPTFENLENVEYSYKLQNFDDAWSNWSTISLKEYTNLLEGNYIMEVKVRNSYGIQSDVTGVSFTILPPWYRHFLAYLFYLALIGASIYFGKNQIKMKIRKNKYYETIEQRRLYLEKETKIKQEQYELEKEIERLENEKLQIKILSKDKELVNNTLQVVKKNKTLNGIIYKLKDININSFDDSTKNQFNKLNKSIAKEVNTDKSWKDLEKHLKNVHFDFLKKLKEKHPTISPREMDLSTYLLMNMSTKEIAEFMNISSAGVELARYRLRKKLNLNRKENLIGYLINI